MKEFLDKRLEVLRAQLNVSSVYGGKHPTTVADLREADFRSFITDIFPYYDAFKGNVNGKSCDFVLANNQDHPRYDSVPNLYPHVVMSAIDTVIDLKGTSQPSEFDSGVKQSFAVKSITRPTNGSRGITTEYDNLSKFWTRLTTRHGLVFVEGDNEKIIEKIKIKIGGKTMKHLIVGKDGTLTGETYENPIKILGVEEIKIFYKLPDFYYSISSNELIFIDKSHLLNEPSGFENIHDFGVYSIDNENALYFLTYILEHFSNERDTSKNRQHFHIELKKLLTGDSKGLFYKLDPSLKWIIDPKTNKWGVTPAEVKKLKDLLEII